LGLKLYIIESIFYIVINCRLLFGRVYGFCKHMLFDRNTALL